MTRGRRFAWWVLVVTLAAATLGAAALGGWQLIVKSRPLPADQVVDRQAAMSAASDGTVAILSYSPNTLQQDFSAAEAMLTGDFRNYYKQFTTQIVTPSVQQKRISSKAVVLRAGVETLTSDGAGILLFVNQTTTQENQAPTLTTSSVRVTLSKVSGKWLISRFDPLWSQPS